MKQEETDQNAIGRINDLQGCLVKENRVSCDQLAPRLWRQNLNTVKEQIDRLKQEIQLYEQVKKHLLEQKKQRKNDSEAYDNFIYCEFYLHQRKSEDPDNFEVFYEYYDLDEDEDQLINAFYTLNEERKDYLKTSLSKMKECKGKNCSGPEGGLKRQSKKDHHYRFKDIRKRYAHALLKPVRTIESLKV